VTHLLFSKVGKHILCAHKVLTGVNQILRKIVLEGLVVGRADNERSVQMDK
jgi:hypothetical protein